MGENVQIVDSVVRGPVIIGDNVTIRNAYVGPYTAIGHDVQIEASEIEHSIVMNHCTICNVQGRIDSSLIADNVRLARADATPKTHRFVLAENSVVQLS